MKRYQGNQDRSCPIDLLRDLISFRSISKGSNLDIAEYVEDILSEQGFTTVRIESPEQPKRVNLLSAIGPLTDGGLMLSGHLDVVPVAGQNWNSDPFALIEKDGVLFGRGTADMKGFIAATLSALMELPLKRLKKPLSLLWTYDEEVGCIGSAQAGPLVKDKLGKLPDACLIGEPTDFNILRMHSGHVTVTIRVKGVGAHSSDPELGISAIRVLNRALANVFALEQQLQQELYLPQYFKRPFVTLNVGEIGGGTAVNIIPDEAWARIGFRPLPTANIDDICARLEEACQKSLDSSGAKIKAEIDCISPPMITDEKSPLEEMLRPLARTDGPISAQYSTDGGNLSQAQIPCLIFGPGSIDVAHKANEWVLASDILLAKDKVRSLLTRWFEL